MKKVSLLVLSITGLILLLATPSFAKEKEVTVSGEAKCVKCTLHQGDKCQTVIQTEGKKGKTVSYYLTDNDAAKSFHENVCHGPQKVTATGKMKKVDGKRELTVSDIKVVK
jgi:competence protein ComGC